MKQHHYSKSDIIRYLSNKMTRSEEAELQKHLLSCNTCREEVRRLRLLVKAMEKNGRSIPSWIVTAAIACTLIGGIYIIRYSDHNSGQRHQIEFNPNPNYNNTDSIPADSIRYDSIRIDDEGGGE